jgi:hypothetical protein
MILARSVTPRQLTTLRAYMPDVREGARRSVPAPRTQADRVADERAYAGIVSRCFGADVQRPAVHRRGPRAMKPGSRSTVKQRFASGATAELDGHADEDATDMLTAPRM